MQAAIKSNIATVAEIKPAAKDWFAAKYKMTSTNPLEIGQDKKNPEIYLFNSGGTETPVTANSALRKALWDELYKMLPEAIQQAHSQSFTSGRLGNNKNNYLYFYINNAIKAGMEAQQKFKARKKGKKDDPHSLRVNAIYGKRSAQQKKASFEILKALGQQNKKQYIKKALHLTAGYQGVGGNTQFEITGKGKFKELYSNNLITLPYGKEEADGTFAKISLEKQDVLDTVSRVLEAFNTNMKLALNGMQNLINDMNQYVLGGMTDSKPAMAAQKDAGQIEDSMEKVVTSQKEKEEAQAQAQNVDDEQYSE